MRSGGGALLPRQLILCTLACVVSALAATPDSTRAVASRSSVAGRRQTAARRLDEADFSYMYDDTDDDGGGEDTAEAPMVAYDVSLLQSLAWQSQDLLDSIWALCDTQASGTRTSLTFAAGRVVPDAARKTLLSQIHQSPQALSIYLCFETGEFHEWTRNPAVLNESRTDVGLVYGYAPPINQTVSWSPECQEKCVAAGVGRRDFCSCYWDVAANGEPKGLLSDDGWAESYDCQSSWWYGEGLREERTLDTSLYIEDALGGQLSLSGSQQLHTTYGVADVFNRTVGVVGIDFSVTSISDLLARNVIASSSQTSADIVVFILQNDGGLIATSMGAEFTYHETNNGTNYTRVTAANSSVPAISEAANLWLLERNATMDGRGYIFRHRYVSALPLLNSESAPRRDVNWTIVISQAINCDAGFFEDEVNMRCSPCKVPASSRASAGVCDRCIAGYYWADDVDGGKGGCRNCPNGATCPGGRVFIVDEGFSLSAYGTV